MNLDLGENTPAPSVPAPKSHFMKKIYAAPAPPSPLQDSTNVSSLDISNASSATPLPIRTVRDPSSPSALPQNPGALVDAAFSPSTDASGLASPPLNQGAAPADIGSEAQTRFMKARIKALTLQLNEMASLRQEADASMSKAVKKAKAEAEERQRATVRERGRERSEANIYIIFIWMREEALLLPLTCA